MKKIFAIASAILAVALCLSSCSSTSASKTVSTLSDLTADRLFDAETFNGTSLDDTRLINPKNYVILGPIIVKSADENGVAGYAEILEAAIAKYPETTAVINIVRDKKMEYSEDSSSYSSKEYDYSWSGIAIKITDTFVDETTTTTTRTTSANGDVTVTETHTKTYKKL